MLFQSESFEKGIDSNAGYPYFMKACKNGP